MKKIKLTQNKIAIVDNDVFNEIKKYKWYARKCRNTFYAQRKFPFASINGQLSEWHNVMMHNFIMNPVQGKFVDHINRNGLDNRKKNLRIVTHSQNHFNEKIRTDNKSGHKGVYFKKQNNRWIAQLGNKYLGCFKTIEEAVKCRDSAFSNLHKSL